MPGNSSQVSDMTTPTDAGPIRLPVQIVYSTQLGGCTAIWDADDRELALSHHGDRAAQIVRALNAQQGHDKLVTALQTLLERYLSLANSGDCGFWNPEEEPQVIEARAAIAGTSAPVRNDKLVDALERIATISAGGPHISATEGFKAVWRALDCARDIAEATLADAKDTG